MCVCVYVDFELLFFLPLFYLTTNIEREDFLQIPSNQMTNILINEHEIILWFKYLICSTTLFLIQIRKQKKNVFILRPCLMNAEDLKRPREQNRIILHNMKSEKENSLDCFFRLLFSEPSMKNNRSKTNFDV